MKKLFFLGIFCCFSFPLMGQSTCQTRVDAHQDATTKQRVAYCLTPEYTAPEHTHDGLVFSTVSTPATPTSAKPSQRPTSKPGVFKAQDYTVTQEYVTSTQFPQVPQGQAAALIMPTQPARNAVYVSSAQLEMTPAEVATTAASVNTPQPVDSTVLMGDEFAYVPAPSTPLGRSTVLFEQPKQAVTSQSNLITRGPQEHSMADEVDTNGNLKTHNVETKAGLQVRQRKAGRQLIKAAAPEPATPAVQIPAQDPAYTYHEDLSQPYQPQAEIPAGTATYAPAAPAETTADTIPAGTATYAPAAPLDTTYEEIPAGTATYAPATDK